MNKIYFIDAQVYYEDNKPYLFYTGATENGIEFEIQKISLDNINISINREEGLMANSVECKVEFDQMGDGTPVFLTVKKDLKKYTTGQKLRVKFSETGKIYDVTIGKIEMVNSSNSIEPEFKYQIILPDDSSIGFWREKSIIEMEVH